MNPHCSVCHLPLPISRHALATLRQSIVALLKVMIPIPIPFAPQPSGRRHPRSSSCKSGSQPQSSSTAPRGTTLSLISNDSIIGPFTHTHGYASYPLNPSDTSVPPLFLSHKPVCPPPEGAGTTVERGTCDGKGIASYDGYPPMTPLLADLK